MRVGSAVSLAATAAPDDLAAHVCEERVERLLRPAAGHRRHDAGDVRLVTAVPDDRLEPLAVGEERARRDRRAVVALAFQAVALRADADPLRTAELCPGLRREPALIGRLRLDDDPRLHRGVEDPPAPAAPAPGGPGPF